MPTECIIVPKPGVALEVAVEHPTFETAVIQEWRGSQLLSIHDVTPSALYRYKPKPPPEYYRKETVMRTQPLTKSLAPGHLAQGLNPFIQLIWMTAREKGSVAEEEIIRALILDYRVLPNTSRSRNAIKRLVNYMCDGALLLRKKDKKYATGLIPSTGMFLIPYKEGFNPMEFQVVEFVQRKGIASRSEIREYILQHLEWMTEYLDDYIERVKDGPRTIWDRLFGRRGKGSIKEVQDGWFEYVKPLEEFKKLA